MAELHVQRKKSKMWLWILIAVVILALVYFYFKGNNNQMAAADIIQPAGIITSVYAPARVRRGSIYSKAIVKYEEGAKSLPAKLYYL